jgi:hypothetical protein
MQRKRPGKICRTRQFRRAVSHAETSRLFGFSSNINSLNVQDVTGMRLAFVTPDCRHGSDAPSSR